MKTMLIVAALAAPAFGQGFDFTLLDKVGANAKNKTEVNLDPNMIKLASGFVGKKDDFPGMKGLISNLTGITIRSFEFDAANKYNEADLDPLRAYLKQQKWSRIIDSKEDKEHSEIYTLPQPDGKLGGLAILSAEEREVSVVFISGSLSTDDLGKLSGTMGIPNITLDHSAKKSKKEE